MQHGQNLPSRSRREALAPSCFVVGDNRSAFPRPIAVASSSSDTRSAVVVARSWIILSRVATSCGTTLADPIEFSSASPNMPPKPASAGTSAIRNPIQKNSSAAITEAHPNEVAPMANSNRGRSSSVAVEGMCKSLSPIR